MRKIIIKLFVLAVVVSAGWSCSEDSLSSQSVFVDPTNTPNGFDRWLMENYIIPYNIDFKYLWEMKESSFTYQLVPANILQSKQMARLVQYLCLEVYDELTGTQAFIRQYFPKILYMVGSPAYNNIGIVLGEAENGLKITLFNINNLNPNNIANLNQYYFRTIHHEFMHIFHQLILFDIEYNQITPVYMDDGWGDMGDPEALTRGWISAYASKAPEEDFVEMIAWYITSTPADWEARLVSADKVFENNTSTGRAFIEQKFEIVKAYLLNTWSIDIDDLRDIVQRRQGDFSSKIDFSNPLGNDYED